jgi:hypothetical protein
LSNNMNFELLYICNYLNFLHKNEVDLFVEEPANLTLYIHKYMIRKDNGPSCMLKTCGTPIVTFCARGGIYVEMMHL